jgi:hypothetical protein
MIDQTTPYWKIERIRSITQIYLQMTEELKDWLNEFVVALNKNYEPDVFQLEACQDGFVVNVWYKINFDDFLLTPQEVAKRINEKMAT